MKSIKLISQDKSHQMNSYYELDYGLFRVDANVYSNAYSINESIKEIYEHDIHDIEFDFYVNGKRCKYEGFEELFVAPSINWVPLSCEPAIKTSEVTS